jgi:hypothetical protein
MPAKHYIDIKAQLLTTTWEGDAIDVDFIEAIKKLKFHRFFLQGKPNSAWMSTKLAYKLKFILCAKFSKKYSIISFINNDIKSERGLCLWYN